MWSELDERTYDEIWNRFHLRFAFRPSVHGEDWPGIAEPADSVTFDIRHVFRSAEREAVEKELAGVAFHAFREVLPPDGELIALDWQHTCYRVRLEAADVDAEWRIPVVPDGDYYIFVADDLSWGWFGHPWEETICVWNEALIAALQRRAPQALSRIARRSGRDVY